MKDKIVTAILISIVASCLCLSIFGAGEGASQKWVENYVSNYVANCYATVSATTTSSNSNGVNTISAGSGNNRVWVEYEDKSVYSLFVTNATEQSATYGITNGFIFVWNGDGTYVNGNGEIIKTYTNQEYFTWHGIESVRTNSLDCFTNNFCITGEMIQPSLALAVTNGYPVASIEVSFFSLIASFLIGIAQAADTATSDVSSWYTPSKWKKNETSTTGSIHYYDEDGEIVAETVYLREDGFLCDEDGDIIQPDHFSTPEARTAFIALEQALQAKEEIETLAENINNEVVTDVTSGTSKSGNSIISVYKGIDSSSSSSSKPSSTISLKEYVVETDENSYYYLTEKGGSTKLGPEWSSGTNPENRSIGQYKDENGVWRTQIYNWKDASPAIHGEGTLSLADVLSEGLVADSILLPYKDGTGSVGYMRFGKLGNSSHSPDEHSIETYINGANTNIAIKGFHSAAIGAIGYAQGTDHDIKWTEGTSAGALLHGDDLFPGNVSWTTTTDADCYYGTGHNGGLPGWNVLPNVTTNYIEADGVTLREYHPEGDVSRKLLAWKNVPPVDNKPYCIMGVGIDDNVGYSFIRLENVLSNSMASVDDASINTNKSGKLQIYKWEDISDGLVVRKDGKVATKIMATEYPIHSGESETQIDIGITNWNNAASTCVAKLSDMLSQKDNTDRAKHRLLARYDGDDDDEELHYVPIGDVVDSGVKSDEVSITTNSTLGATFANKASIYGFRNAAEGQVPYKTSGGTIAWKKVGSGAIRINTDGRNSSSGDVVVGSGLATNLITFASEEDSNIKFTVTKTNDTTVVIKIGVYYR